MNKILMTAIVAGIAGTASADVISETNAAVLEWGLSPTNGLAVTAGETTLFPSAITVAGASGTITDVNVTLHAGLHTYIADMELTLVSPSGVGVRLLDYEGFVNSDDLDGELGFDDQALSQAPAATGDGAPAGIWQVSDFGTTDDSGVTFTLGADLSIFNGEDANGDWSIYVFDQNGGDTGSFQGWTIDIVTVPAPASAALLGLGGIAAIRRRR